MLPGDILNLDSETLNREEEAEDDDDDGVRENHVDDNIAITDETRCLEVQSCGRTEDSLEQLGTAWSSLSRQESGTFLSHSTSNNLTTESYL